MASVNGSVVYDGTPPASHDPNGSPSGTTTPGGHGDGSSTSTPYVPVQNGRKRKADGTSSRGVANLTPEQLAKKRANDREAQRAIRERTKNTIETLERRIKELESQKPFQELQNVIRVKDAVLAENDDLKRRMQSILALLQPLAASQGLNGQSQSQSQSQSQARHAHGLGHAPMVTAAATATAAHIIALADGSDLAAATARQSPLPMPPPPQAPMYHGVQQPTAQSAGQPSQYDPSFQQHHLHPDLRNAHPSPTPQRPPPSPANGHNQHDLRRWSPSTTASPAQYQPASLHSQQVGYAQDSNQQQVDRYGLHHLVEEQHLNSNSPSITEARRRDLVPLQTEEPLYRRLPVNTEPTCTLDNILGGFEAERRRAAQSGTPAATLVGPSYPSISSLLNPERAAASHPLSKVFTDILGKFPSISDVPEQIAVLYIMFLIMRWHIAPTQENYERLPEWARPVRSQLEIPHPAWIDHLPWPTMRDRIIRASAISAYPFESFFIPYTTTMSLNWPYDHSQCLLPAAYRNKNASGVSTGPGADGNSTPRAGSNDAAAATSAIENALNGGDEGEEFMINPVFESHLRNLNNWSLGTQFRNAFPDLVDDVKIRDVRPPVAATL